MDIPVKNGPFGRMDGVSRIELRMIFKKIMANIAA